MNTITVINTTTPVHTMFLCAVVGVGEGESVVDGGGVVYADVGAVDECLLLWTVVEGVDGVQWVTVVQDTQFPVGKEHTLNSIAGDCYSQIDCTSHASMLIAFYK